VDSSILFWGFFLVSGLEFGKCIDSENGGYVPEHVTSSIIVTFETVRTKNETFGSSVVKW
jgi:hypothetical protein